MVDETDEPEDVASLMEALWGRRADVPEDEPAGQPHDSGKAPDDEVPAPAPATHDPGAIPPPAAAFDGFKAYLDAAFADQLTSLRSHVDAALAYGLQEVRTETLAAVDARLSAALVEVRAEAVQAAEALAAGAEVRLLGRLDGIAAALAEVSERSAVASTALSRLDALERETAERLAAVEQRERPEVVRLASAVEDLEQRSVTAAERADVQSAALEAAETGMAASGRDVQEQLNALAVSVDETTTSAASAALARMEAMEERINLDIVRVSESVAAIRTELAGSVADLETALGRWAADWRADVDARLAGAVRQIGPSPADAGRRLRGRKVRRDELQRLVESVAAWRAQSVGPEEFVALRRELEAKVERRFAALDAGKAAVDRGAKSPPG